MFRLLKERPKLTVPALQPALAAEGLTVGDATLKRFLKRHRLQRRQRLNGRRQPPAFRPPDRA